MRHSIPNLRILRAFDAVGRLESVSGAARAIHLSQPAVTQAIAKIEGIVGEQLFERRATGTYLTESGVALHGETTKLLNGIESALSDLLPQLTDTEISVLINKITNSQLECLISISECTTSKSAASKYETHESSINRSVRELERTVGEQLVKRTASGLQVTRQGEEFATNIALIFREFETALQVTFSRRLNKAVAIGAPVLDNAELLAGVVNEFVDMEPGVGVRLVNEPSESLRLRLRSGTLDMIVGVLKPHSTDLTSEILFEECYHVVARHDHPLCSKGVVSIEDLSEYDWVVPNRHAPRRGTFEKIFSGNHKRPLANIETHSLATITMTLASSNRLALLTSSELKDEGASDRLVALPYHIEDAHTNIGLTYLTSAARSPHHDTLVRLFRKHAQSLQKAEQARHRGAA